MVKFTQATRTAGQINKIVLLAICMAAQQSLNSWPSYRYSNNLHTFKRNLGQCGNSRCVFKNSDSQIDSTIIFKSTIHFFIELLKQFKPSINWIVSLLPPNKIWNVKIICIVNLLFRELPHLKFLNFPSCQNPCQFCGKSSHGFWYPDLISHLNFKLNFLYY